jgi:hypothetical protein
LGYKGNDSGGAFLGGECHTFVDQPKAATYEERLAVFEAARVRTAQRMREIAADIGTKQWRRDAAQWFLDHQEAP